MASRCVNSPLFYLGALGERAAEILPVEAGKNPESLKIYKHIVEFRETMLEWSAYSEQAMMEARMSAKLQLAGEEG